MCARDFALKTRTCKRLARHPKPCPFWNGSAWLRSYLLPVRAESMAMTTKSWQDHAGSVRIADAESKAAEIKLEKNSLIRARARSM